MIHFLFGKPGSGKGRVLMEWVWRYLEESNLPIFTNFPVKLDPWILGRAPQIGLKAAWQFEHKKGEVPASRLHLWDPTGDEARNFWEHRECGLVPGPRDSKGRIDGVDGDGLKRAGPCIYLIDECHKFFDARRWAENDRGFGLYAAVHRHIGDEVWLVSQSAQQVDVRLRMLCQDFWWVRNHGQEVFGKFRKPDVLTLQVFQDEGTTMLSETRNLRLRRSCLLQCYDTTGGVGPAVSLGGGDSARRRRGLPFWLLPLAVVGVGVAVLTAGWVAFGAVSHVGKYGLGWVGNMVGSRHDMAARVLPAAGVGMSNAPGGMSNNGGDLTNNGAPGAGPGLDRSRHLTGIGTLQGRPVAWFSDGLKIYAGPDVLIGADFVVWRGLIYRL